MRPSGLPIYGYRWKLNGYNAIKIPIGFFSRQLRELGIINTSRELVSYFSKKFANLSQIERRGENVGPKDLTSAYPRERKTPQFRAGI
jgi:hypothetical protein